MNNGCIYFIVNEGVSTPDLLKDGVQTMLLRSYNLKKEQESIVKTWTDETKVISYYNVFTENFDRIGVETIKSLRML